MDFHFSRTKLEDARKMLVCSYIISIILPIALLTSCVSKSYEQKCIELGLPIKPETMNPCPMCNGRRLCPECQGNSIFLLTCDFCHSTHLCPLCQGSGKR